MVAAEVDVIKPIVTSETQTRDAWLANLSEAYPRGTSLERRLSAAVAISRLASSSDRVHKGFMHQATSKILQAGSRGDAAATFLDAVRKGEDARRRDTDLACLLPLAPPHVLKSLASVLRDEMNGLASERGTSEIEEMHAAWASVPATFSSLTGLLPALPFDKMAGVVATIGPHCISVRGPHPEYGALQAAVGHVPAESLALFAAATGRNANTRAILRCIEEAAMHVPYHPGGAPRPWVGLLWPPNPGPAGPGGRPALLPPQFPLDKLIAWGVRHGLPPSPLMPVPLPPRIFVAAALTASGLAKQGWGVLTDALPADDRPLLHPLGLAMASAKISGFVRFCSGTSKGHPTLAGFAQRTCPAVVHASGLVVGASSSRDDAAPLPPADGDAGPLRWLDLDASRAAAASRGFACTPPSVRVAMVCTAAEARAAAAIVAAAPVIGLDCEWAPTPLPLAPEVLDRVLDAVDASARTQAAGGTLPPRQPVRCVDAARRAGLAPPAKFPVSLAQVCTGTHGFLIDPILVALDGAGGGRAALQELGEAIGTFEDEAEDEAAADGGAASAGGDAASAGAAASATAPAPGREGVIAGFGLDTDYSMLFQSLRDVGAGPGEGLVPVDLMATLPGPGLRHPPRREQALLSRERKSGVSELVRRARTGAGEEDGTAADDAGGAASLEGEAAAAASAGPEIDGVGSSGRPTAGSSAGGGDGRPSVDDALKARSELDAARRRRPRAFADLQLGSWMMSLGGATGGRPQKSLSELSMATTGQPLDKSCQVSDWDRRPLTSAQALYAITDAYVPVVAYGKALEAHSRRE